MHHLRTAFHRILLVAILMVPVFVYAQTATTTDTATSTPLSSTLYDLISSQLQQLTNSATQSAGIPSSAANPVSNYLDIKSTPENPGPNQMITVTVDSYLSDLDKATFKWSVNGQLISSGVGQRTFSFQNGASGVVTRLSVSISTPEGDYVTKKLSWQPIGITTLWQAATYTPPFYRGKALLAPQAQVQVVAIPDNNTPGNALSAGNLVYVWKKDGAVVSSASGYGKNVFSFLGPKPYSDANVSVVASSLDNSVQSETQVALSLTQPFILFYEKDPLLGVLYNNPIQMNYTLSKKQITIVAEPYFFSNDQSDTQTLSYTWSMNGQTSQNYGRSITLRNDTGAQGDSIISLSMSNIEKTFQEASQSLHIYFNNSGNTQGNTLF